MSIGRLFGIQSELRLSGREVYLRAPDMRDHAEWAQLRAHSQGFLVPWEPTWPADDLTRSAFRHRLAMYAEEHRRGESNTFLLFRAQDNVLLGGLTLGNIRHGVAQTTTMGYWMGEPFAGHGYMRQGVELALDFSFRELGLHRVEAACLPGNARSSGLLMRLGFHQEGLARAYLQINGRWEDHLLFARLSTDPAPVNLYAHTKA